MAPSSKFVNLHFGFLRWIWADPMGHDVRVVCTGNQDPGKLNIRSVHFSIVKVKERIEKVFLINESKISLTDTVITFIKQVPGKKEINFNVYFFDAKDQKHVFKCSS